MSLLKQLEEENVYLRLQIACRAAEMKEHTLVRTLILENQRLRKELEQLS